MSNAKPPQYIISSPLYIILQKLWSALRGRGEKAVIPMTSTVLAKLGITRTKYHRIFLPGEAYNNDIIQPANSILSLHPLSTITPFRKRQM